MGFDTVAYEGQIDIFRRNLISCDCNLITNEWAQVTKLRSQVI